MNNIPTYKTQLGTSHLKGVKNTIAIASGKGGVGKSTIAVNLAITLAQKGARVGILDADIYGPSVPIMLGETSPIAHDNDLYIPAFAHGIHAMSIGFLAQNDGPLIWRGPMLAKSLLQMMNVTKWDNLDFLIIDLPPGTGDIQLSLVQKIPLTAAIVVTTPQSVATLDAQKAIKMFVRTNIHTLGIVENMALHTCCKCGHQEAIFGQDGAKALSDEFRVPLLGQLALDKRIVELSEQGIPAACDEIREPFVNIAERILVELAKLPVNDAAQ